MRVAITGVGKAVPDRVVPNSELAPRMGVDAQWIEARTGILERRYAGDTQSSASLGTQAACAALAVSGVRPEDLSLVIVATCTPDYLLPATASIIQDSIGAGRAGAFDLGAACSGFVYGLSVAAGMIGSKAAERVLIVGVDLLSRHLDLDDPMTAPLFGDAAAAVVLEACPGAEPLRFELGSDGGGLKQVLIPGGGSRLPDTGLPFDPACLTIHMSGREVFRNAVRVMSELGTRFGKDSFDLVVAHQANRRILDECAAQMGVDREKFFMNIQQYGNTSAASIPLALCEAWESGRLQPGSRLLMLAFGAGYTWGAAALRWTLAPPADSGGQARGHQDSAQTLAPSPA